MRKIWVFFSIILVFTLTNFTLLYAKTIEFTANPIIDYSFTKNNPLTYSNSQFQIGKGIIKPIIKTNIEKDLSNINHVSVIGDNQYYYKFYVDVRNISLSTVNYVGFNLTGFKKYDDVSYTDGKIRIIFEDLMDKGDLSLTDNQVLLRNPTSLKLDPIIQLLSNTTNKAYHSGSLSTNNINSNFNSATTEFIDLFYFNVNVSNNIWFSKAVTSTLTQQRFLTVKFTFNVSGISNIINMTYCYEGHWGNSFDVGSTINYWYNATSGNWISDDDEVPSSIDYVFCHYFDSNYTDFYNSTSGIVQFGIRLQAPASVTVTSSLTDFINLTIQVSEPITTTTTSTTTSTITTTIVPTTTTLTTTTTLIPTTTTLTTSTTTTSTTTISTTTTIPFNIIIPWIEDDRILCFDIIRLNPSEITSDIAKLYLCDLIEEIECFLTLPIQNKINRLELCIS